MPEDIADQGRRARAFTFLQAHRVTNADVEVETLLSINSWIDRVREETLHAHRMCRGGDAQAEFDAWTAIASTAVARMEDLLKVIDGTETREVVLSDGMADPAPLGKHFPKGALGDTAE